MPTNRTRRTRKIVPSTISDPMRYFLETGCYRLRELFPDDPRGRVEVFKLAYPSQAMRKRLKAVWMQHKGDVLADWQRQGKKGKPWAESFFNE